MSILVVDDNTMLLSKIVRSLIRANRKVRSATSLTEAREVLNRETPEVLCLDLQLPDGSGMDLLEEIRAEGKQLPVIIISGHYSEANKQRAEQLGVSAFFSKPFVLQDLHKALDEVLEKSQEKEEKSDSVEAEHGPVLQDLEHDRVSRAKRAYTTRRVSLHQASQLIVNGYRPQAGDLVMARVDKRLQHTHIQLPSGRRAMMNVGDEIIVCYGNRYAPDQFESVIPEDLSPCHLVAAGGIASNSLSRNKAMKAATEISPIGVLADSSGQPLNIRNYALKSMPAPVSRPPVTVVIGTSMNAGKTTVAADTILGMSRQGLRVGAAKVTGTGAGGDVYRMLDSGAEHVFDFTDCGHPTTYKTPIDQCVDIMQTLIGKLSAEKVDTIVIEVADGILQDETRALLKTPEFRAMTDDIIFAAGDAMGALGGISWLQKQGLNIVGVSGVLTSSPLAMREFNMISDLTVYERGDLKSGAFPEGRLADKHESLEATMQFEPVALQA